MTVSLTGIWAAARAHLAPLAAESAGYLLLAVTDQVASEPRVPSADEIELQAEGGVRLALRGGAASAATVELALRGLLRRTLEVSSPGGPALRRAAERSEAVGLAAFVRELEAALIPVNRSAAKRALSRLYREAERARTSGRLDSLLSASRSPAATEPETRLSSAPVAQATAADPAPVPLPA